MEDDCGNNDNEDESDERAEQDEKLIDVGVDTQCQKWNTIAAQPKNNK